MISKISRPALSYYAAPPTDSGSSPIIRVECKFSYISNHTCQKEILDRYGTVHLNPWLAWPSDDHPLETRGHFLTEEITEEQVVELYFKEPEQTYQNLFGLVYQTAKTTLLQRPTNIQFDAIVKDSLGRYCFKRLEFSHEDLVAMQTYSFDVPVFVEKDDLDIFPLIYPEDSYTALTAPLASFFDSTSVDEKYTWIRFKRGNDSELQRGATGMFNHHRPEIIIFSTNACLRSIELVEALILHGTSVIILPSPLPGQFTTFEGAYDALEKRNNLEPRHLTAPFFQAAENARHLQSIAIQSVIRICQFGTKRATT